MIAGSRVLLTGATGFLGAQLLAELLARGAGEVRCLVRAPDPAAAAARLARITADPAAVPLPGDLGRPALGWSPAEFAAVARDTDLIVHAGAWVNLALPYRSVKPANVDGAREMVRLAHAGGAPLHHISTLSVFGSGRGGVSEVLEVPRVEGLATGYAQSKWAADRMMAQAVRSGLPVSVIRTGRLFARSDTGEYNAEDLLVQMVRACLLLGAAPGIDAAVLIAPVDGVAAAVCGIADRPDATGRAYHVAGVGSLSWLELVGLMGTPDQPMSTVPYDRWRALILDAGHNDDRLLRLATMLGDRPPLGAGWSVDMANTRAALGDALPSILPSDTHDVVARMLKTVRDDLFAADSAPVR